MQQALAQAGFSVKVADLRTYAMFQMLPSCQQVLLLHNRKTMQFLKWRDTTRQEWQHALELLHACTSSVVVVFYLSSRKLQVTFTFPHEKTQSIQIFNNIWWQKGRAQLSTSTTTSSTYTESRVQVPGKSTDAEPLSGTLLHVCVELCVLHSDGMYFSSELLSVCLSVSFCQLDFHSSQPNRPILPVLLPQVWSA